MVQILFKDLEGRYKYKIMVHHVTGTWLITNRPNSHGLEGVKISCMKHSYFGPDSRNLLLGGGGDDAIPPTEIIVTVTVA
jgi:hypothetical protein